MTSSTTRSRAKRATTSNPGRGRKTSGRGRAMKWVFAAVGGVVALSVLFLIFSGADQPTTDSAAPGGSEQSVGYDVGEPGIGQSAPDFTLPGTDGEEVSLADYRGGSVLLYFQEGLMCQPCWDQMTDFEQSDVDLQAAGVDSLVSITTDPIDLIQRKTQDMGLSTLVLSDPDLAVTKEYGTNQFGMMGDSRNGHSFILVGPDGTIQWRADYGGAPDYTMFVPVEKVLSDLKAGAAA